jgi:hypothetical protein
MADSVLVSSALAVLHLLIVSFVVEAVILYFATRARVITIAQTSLLMNSFSALLFIVIALLVTGITYRDMRETSPIPDIVTPSIVALLAYVGSLIIETCIAARCLQITPERAFKISAIGNLVSAVALFFIGPR